MIGSVSFGGMPVSNIAASATHSGGCQDVKGHRCLPRALLAPCRGGNTLAHLGAAAKEVGEFVVAAGSSVPATLARCTGPGMERAGYCAGATGGGPAWLTLPRHYLTTYAMPPTNIRL